MSIVIKSKIICECISKRSLMVWSALEARNLEQTQTLRPITASSLLSRMLWAPVSNAILRSTRTKQIEDVSDAIRRSLLTFSECWDYS